MKQYHIVFGAYIRSYADYTIWAENDDAARQPRLFNAAGWAEVSPRCNTGWRVKRRMGAVKRRIGKGLHESADVCFLGWRSCRRLP